MKKIYFLFLLLSINYYSNAQHLVWKFYDSVSVFPKFRIMNPLSGAITDSLVAKRANGTVTKIAHNQLQINFSQLLGRPNTLSSYGITDGVTNSVFNAAMSLKYDNSNPSNFINISQARIGIAVTGNGSYNSSTGLITINPYIPAVSSVFGRTGAVTAQSGDYTTTLVTEGTNQYWTISRFNTAFLGKTTTELNEGANLYFTTIRARTSVSASNGITYNSGTGNFILTKRQETYSGTTNASGNYTVTFSTAYSVAPNVQANIIGATDTQNIRITSVSTTGFTVLVRNRVDVIGLLPTWNNVSGASVDILITEK